MAIPGQTGLGPAPVIEQMRLCAAHIKMTQAPSTKADDNGPFDVSDILSLHLCYLASSLWYVCLLFLGL